jgi:L-2-hydroxyglutarate oxidase LhgO
MNSFVGEIEARGSNIVFNSHVTKIKSHSNGFDVSIADGTKIRSSYLINAAGLWAGQVSRLLAQNDSYQQFYDIQFVRGRYLSYHGKHPFLHLIYPVPVKDGLGTHLTLDLGGQLKIGPDVEKIREISYHVCDIDDIKTEMYHSVKKYWPSCNFNNLSYSYCGIRPKATFKGELVNDFVIEDQSKHGIRKLVNLFGIESPGLTSCLGIAKEIKERLCI